MLNVTAAIIRKDGKILICKRSDGGCCAHHWEFPGGKIEAGETPFDCIIREIREELFLEINPVSVFAEYSYSYPDRDIAFTFIEAELVSGEPRLSVHEEVRWVLPSELGEYEWCPADVRAAEMLKNV